MNYRLNAYNKIFKDSIEHPEKWNIADHYINFINKTHVPHIMAVPVGNFIRSKS